WHADARWLHSFPTRRSSDLAAGGGSVGSVAPTGRLASESTRANGNATARMGRGLYQRLLERSTTRLRPRRARRIRSRASPETCRSEEHTSELQSRSDLVCRL